MKRNVSKIIGCLCGLLLLAQGAAAWGVTLSSENNIDTISITSTLGITFGNFNTLASGNVFDNGVNVNALVVGPTSQAGAGSFITGADGSTGLNGSFYLTNTKFAQLNTQVMAAPAAPGSNPLDSDFVVLGSTLAAVQSGTEGKVRAADTALYAQDFTIGTPGAGGSGDLSVSANYLYNFLLAGFEAANDSVLAQGAVFFQLILNGAIQTTFDPGFFTATLAQMDGTDILNPQGPFSQTFTVNAGDTGTFVVGALTVSEVSSVPEPGTFLLVGSGILGVFLVRRKTRS